MDETTRAILYLLGTGETVEGIVRQHPTLTARDVQEAAAEALRALEVGETREARVARVRTRYPHAFEPWSAQEDAQLLDEFRHGATVAALSRAFGRPPGAVRMRLQKLGVDPRRRAAQPGPSYLPPRGST